MFKAACLLTMFVALPLQAGVYKCEMPNGRTAYQDKPCAQTAVKSQALDLPQRSAESLRQEQWERDLLKWRLASPEAGDNVNNNKLTETVWQVDAYLKGALKDPDSLQYIAWGKVLTEGSKYLVRCRYRAKNSFGGYSTEEGVFYLNSNGQVQRVVLYEPGKSLPAHFY